MLNKYPDIFWLIFDKCFKFAHIIASTTAHATAMCLQNDKLDSNGVNVHYGTKKNLAPEPYPFDCRAGPPKNLPLCMSVVCQKLRTVIIIITIIQMRVLSRIFHWGKSEEPKAERGVGFLGEWQPSPHQLGVWGAL